MKFSNREKFAKVLLINNSHGSHISSTSEHEGNFNFAHTIFVFFGMRFNEFKKNKTHKNNLLVFTFIANERIC